MTTLSTQTASRLSGSTFLLLCAGPCDRNLLAQLLGHLGVISDTAPLVAARFDLPARLTQDGIVIDTDSAAGRAALAELAARAHRPPILAIGAPPADGADASLAKPIPGADRLAAAIAALLHPPVAPGLAELLDLAGPDHARPLLAQMLEDISAARSALTTAARADDRDVIRSQTHILVALTGTLGAAPLQAECAALNAAAHRGEPDTVRRRAAALDAGLAALLSELRTAADGLAPPL